MDRITEQTSKYDNLEQKSVGEILADINTEDQLVANAVQKSLSSIEHLLEAMEPKFKNGGRLFYIGAGTSGRLGILDASEIPPTYGMSHDKVIGIIAGGDGAISFPLPGQPTLRTAPKFEILCFLRDSLKSTFSPLSSK